jgi:hypothetical protein
MATLAEVKQAIGNPMLTPYKRQLDEAIRQLESLASSDKAKGIDPAVWAMIFQVIMQIIGVFIHPPAPPPPNMPATQASPAPHKGK